MNALSKDQFGEKPEVIDIDIDCTYCGKKHPATYHHDGQWDGRRYYESDCDGYAVYHNEDAKSL